MLVNTIILIEGILILIAISLIFGLTYQHSSTCRLLYNYSPSAQNYICYKLSNSLNPVQIIYYHYQNLTKQLHPTITNFYSITNLSDPYSYTTISYNGSSKLFFEYNNNTYIPEYIDISVEYYKNKTYSNNISYLAGKKINLDMMLINKKIITAPYIVKSVVVKDNYVHYNFTQDVGSGLPNYKFKILNYSEQSNAANIEIGIYYNRTEIIIPDYVI